MKVVFDVNVVIAALASRGLCESIFEYCLSGHEIILCVDLLDEIAKNLRRKMRLPATVVDDIRKLLQEHGTMLDPVPLPPDACRDPEDTKILGLATASNADFIVTGDKDLLVLEKYRGIPILSPRSFSEIVHSKKAPEDQVNRDESREECKYRPETGERRGGQGSRHSSFDLEGRRRPNLRHADV